MDSHEAFLQAAGGKATRAASVLDGAEDATALERALATLVRKAHFEPRHLGPRDLEPLREVAGDSALEFVQVLGLFHFINRIADTLGVEFDYPRFLRRFEWLRRGLVRLMSRVMRFACDFAPHAYDEDRSAAVASRLRESFGAVDDRELAPLAARPAAVRQLELQIDELLVRSTLAPATIERVFAVVGRALPGCAEDTTGIHPRPNDPVEAFAFVGTRYANRTTPAMIDALRAAGYTDRGILDLAIAVALANAWGRQYRLIPIPAVVSGPSRSKVADASAAQSDVTSRARTPAQPRL